MKKHFKPLIFTLVVSLLIGGTLYAYNAPKAELLNPDGEQVFQTEDGKTFLVDEQGLGGSSQDNVESFVNYGSDVIGTKIGTSTTYVGFYGDNTATSSYIKKTGGQVTDAVFTVSAMASSSHTGVASFTIFGSYDDYCNTASTTAGSNQKPVLMSDINWYDVGRHLRRNPTEGTYTINTATTTILWSGIGAKDNRTFVMTDLNYECLKVSANASSTELFMQVRLK